MMDDGRGKGRKGNGGKAPVRTTVIEAEKEKREGRFRRL